MTNNNQSALEAVAKALCTAHYCKRFGKPANDPHILDNVRGNWHLFTEEARAAIAALQPASGEPVPTNDKPMVQLLRELGYTVIPPDKGPVEIPMLIEEKPSASEPVGYYHPEQVNRAKILIAADAIIDRMKGKE